MTYFWIIFFCIDWLLFVPVALTTLYLFVFAVASLFSHQRELPVAKHLNRIIVLIPSCKKDESILLAVNSILGQSYPQRMFDVVVISDHQSEMTNMRLAQLPITLLTPNFEKSSKAKSLQYAIFNLPQFKIYDAVVVLDADNIVEPDFLEQMNNAYEQAGTKALQAHRLSRNRDTSAARLDAIFEEINNAIFRRGHIVLGFSAAISGSGMLFEFEWFKRSIMEAHNAIGEDKELEAILMRESVFVDYFDNIHVYDEKARTTSKFNDQRKRWAMAQLHALFSNLKYLPKAFLGRHYDHLDKLIQWMLVPRTIMIGVIMVMCAILPFIYMTSAVKWWAVAALALFAFSLATPDYLVDKNWDTDFLLVPVVTIWGIFNIFRIGKTEVSTRMNSLRRTVKRLTPIIKFRHD